MHAFTQVGTIASEGSDAHECSNENGKRTLLPSESTVSNALVAADQ